MQLLTKEVRDGLHTGKTVWICHYNRPDLNKKPLRNLPPTKCLIKSNDELPKNKTVYYSADHFAPYTAKGTVSKKVISPVDNTGYRTLCGNELYVFDDEEDCQIYWNIQLGEHIARIDEVIATVKLKWINEKQNLLQKLI